MGFPHSHPLSPEFVMVRTTNNKLVWWLSIMAGLQSLTGGSVIMQLLPEKLAGALVAIVGSLQAATAAYIAGKRPIRNGGDQSG